MVVPDWTSSPVFDSNNQENVFCLLEPIEDEHYYLPDTEDIHSFRKYRAPLRVAAIGDGGNDVSMIQAAHAGIGIDANEGTLVDFS